MFWNIFINLIMVLVFSLNSQPALVKLSGKIISPQPQAKAFNLAAKRGSLLLANDHFFLFTQKADEVQAIASISKLMTAMVFLDNNPGWDKVYKIQSSDLISGGKLHLFLGEQVTLRNLFYTSLVASDNGASVALVHASGLSSADFIKKMNQKAQALGLSNTHFEEPTGLSDSNLSTAREVALMAQAAFKYPEIREATTKATYRFKTLGGRLKEIESTDYLLDNAGHNDIKVLAGKTGYTDAAGYSFVGLLKKGEAPAMIAVILNSSSKNKRFLESEELLNWVTDTYQL